MTAPVLACEGIAKRLGGRSVLSAVSLALYPGEVLGLIGPGGHGKSVLLKLMSGLMTPDEGRVLLNGRDLASLDPAGLAEARASMGYLFQNNALFDFMTVRDNVRFPLVQQGACTPAEMDRRVEAQLGVVGLSAALDQMPRELSGGMQKRVGLVRAVITQPRITLYDDPTAGLDPVTSSKIFKLIGEMQARDGANAAVVVSHDIDRMRAICDRYVMLYQGKVLFSGREDEMTQAPETVRTFFHGALLQASGAR